MKVKDVFIVQNSMLYKLLFVYTVMLVTLLSSSCNHSDVKNIDKNVVTKHAKAQVSTTSLIGKKDTTPACCKGAPSRSKFYSKSK